MKKILLLVLIISSFSINLFAQEKMIPSSQIQSFDWNQKIQNNDSGPSRFNRSFSKIEKEINPEFAPNAHLGLQMKKKGIQFGILLKF